MDNIAGTKSSLTWAVNLTVLLLVILWLVPTIGLLVSSFRDRDQISESGWWMAPFPVEQAFRGRAAADGVTQEGDLFVLTGNIFEDEEVVSMMGEGAGGSVAAFGDSGRDPGAYPAGEVAELDDGASLVVERRLPLHDGRGPRRPHASTSLQTRRQSSRSRTTRRASPRTTWTRRSSTR